MEEIAKKLLQQEEVTFRPKGNSMVPLIFSGDEVTLVPHDPLQWLKPGTIVLARVKGKILLHKISGFKELPPVTTSGGKKHKVYKYQISNNRGHVNGWASIIYGVKKEHFH